MQFMRCSSALRAIGTVSACRGTAQLPSFSSAYPHMVSNSGPRTAQSSFPSTLTATLHSHSSRSLSDWARAAYPAESPSEAVAAPATAPLPEFLARMKAALAWESQQGYMNVQGSRQRFADFAADSFAQLVVQQGETEAQEPGGCGALAGSFRNYDVLSKDHRRELLEVWHLNDPRPHMWGFVPIIFCFPSNSDASVGLKHMLQAQGDFTDFKLGRWRSNA